MSKRTAEDAGLDAQKDLEETQNEENNEEVEEEVEEEGEEGDDDENEEGSSEESDDGSSDASGPDVEGLRAFALSWLEDKRIDGVSPQNIFESLGMKVALSEMPLSDQWELLERVVTSEGVSMAIFRSLFNSHRVKLPYPNTLEDAIELLKNCNNIVILTGAGVSVSCGIPDFRSPGGLYSIIEQKYNLPEPQCLFDIHYLRDDPHPFFEFAREIYPGKHKPSPTHYFIKELASRGKLLRNYTQNIDTLEIVSGIDPSKIVNCHGSFATASCVVCKKRVNGDEIRDDIMNSVIPLCTACNDDNAFMKPDIVFFGEPLPDRFDECLKEDTEKIDLLLVMGSSLKVKPVAFVPEFIKADVPQVLINRELVAQPHEFDYAYLGDCDAFVLEVCKRLGWTLDGKAPEEYPAPPPSSTPSSVPSSSSPNPSASSPLTLTSLNPTLSSDSPAAAAPLASLSLTGPSLMSPLLTSVSTPTLTPLPTPTFSSPPLPEFSTPSLSSSMEAPILSLLPNGL